MSNNYTAIIKQDGLCWVGWIEEVPGVNCQAKSKAELIGGLKETLNEAFAFNRDDALSFAGNEHEEE
jgi:predicted RNase H-like HicB family nuclease